MPIQYLDGAMMAAAYFTDLRRKVMQALSITHKFYPDIEAKLDVNERR